MIESSYDEIDKFIHFILLAKINTVALIIIIIINTINSREIDSIREFLLSLSRKYYSYSRYDRKNHSCSNNLNREIFGDLHSRTKFLFIVNVRGYIYTPSIPFAFDENESFLIFINTMITKKIFV